jgi:hypothetical protein|tara:strand:+ start:1073 stop:1228 length:156 start_codon:yes stop_codon:yes gene_type:complete
MAVALGKKHNAADVRFRTRPAGLSVEPALGVALFRRAVSPTSKSRLDGELD